MKMYNLSSVYDGDGALFEGRVIGEVFFFFPLIVQSWITNKPDFIVEDIDDFTNHGTLHFDRDSKADFIYLLQLYDLSAKYHDYNVFVKYLPKRKFYFTVEATIINELKKLKQALHIA